MTTAAPRHCMVVHAYYPRTETRVQREAEALVATGYEVDVICLRGEGERPRERYRGVDVYRVGVSLRKESLVRQFANYLHFFLRAFARLATLQRSRGYGSIQVHNLPDFLVFCAIVPRLRGVPVILDLHDLMPEFLAARLGSGARHPLGRLVRWQERISCRFADHVITVSEPWRDRLISRGVAPERCSVVMNVADDRIFSPRPRHGDGDAFRLFYHGSVTRRYGLDVAIRAVALARADVPNLRLTIRGTGDAREDLLAIRDELGLRDEVELVDEHVPEEALPDLIASADLGVVPYRDDVFTDGILPTKLMEYAAVGLPCIASRTSAIERYFTGTMVEFARPGDAEDLARCIRELAGDPERRAALARGARAFTSRYAWSELAPTYVALVRSLADGRDRVSSAGSRR